MFDISLNDLSFYLVLEGVLVPSIGHIFARLSEQYDAIKRMHQQ